MDWSGVHHSHRFDLRRSAVFTGLAILCALLVLIFVPNSEHPVSGSAYLPFHALLELVTISISMMIFTVSLQTQRRFGSKAVKWVGALFLAVALLDVAHLITFPGMVMSVSFDQLEASQDFRVAARFFAGMGLLGLAILPPSQTRGSSRLFYLAPTLIIAVIVIAFIVIRPSWEGAAIGVEGRQSLLSVVEFVLLTVYLVSVVNFIRGTQSARRYNYSALALAAILIIISEVFFITSRALNDYHALIAHLYKLLAYLVLCRALFVETIEKPWKLLRHSEGRLEATLNALPDVLFELDLTERIINVRAAQQTGLLRVVQGYINKKIGEVLPDKAASTCIQGMQSAMKSGYSRDHLIDLDTPTGKRCFSLSISFVSGTQAEDARFLILARDINDSVAYQQQLQYEARFNNSLLQLARNVSTQSEDAILDFAVKQARYLTESPQACLCLVEKNSISGGAFHSGPAIKMPDALVKQLLASTATTVMNDASAKEFVYIDAESADIDRFVCFPASEKGTVKLLICVFNKANEYQQRDIDTLEIFTDAVWQSLRRNRQDSTIEKLSLALEQSPNSVMISGLDGRIEYVNDAFVRNSGFSREEALGAQPNIVKSGKNDQSIYDQMWDQLMQGKPWQGELINRRKDDSEVPERVLIYPVRDKAGNIINYISHKEDLTELRAADERIQQLSNYDQLTDLPNREVLEQEFSHAVRTAQQYQGSIAIFCLNLDNFRAINDALGQGAGDEVLRLVASRLRMAMAVRDVVTRQSADTFVLMLQGMGEERAASVASGLMNVIGAPLWVHDTELNLTASVGVAIYPCHGDSLETLMMRAEAAMFQVKASGRNSIQFFEPQMQSQTSRFLEISNHLKHAMDHGELELVYQPQYSLDQQRIVAAEALLRWHDSTLGNISPADFIPVAESNGFIIPISDWVVETASRQLNHWRQEGISDLVLAINLSAVQFRQSDLSHHLSQIVAREGVEPDAIEFELTEAVALQDPLLASTTMKKLTEQGFHLSIDDFGTGYSSMSYLKRFSVEKLKIDQSFVRDLKHSESDRAIVKAIIEMAHSLGLRTIAEGVETTEQLDILRQYGCDEIQGYVYSEPLSADAFFKFLESRKRLG